MNGWMGTAQAIGILDELALWTVLVPSWVWLLVLMGMGYWLAQWARNTFTEEQATVVVSGVLSLTISVGACIGMWMVWQWALALHPAAAVGLAMGVGGLIYCVAQHEPSIRCKVHHQPTGGCHECERAEERPDPPPPVKR